MSAIFDYLRYLELEGWTADALAGRRRFLLRLERTLGMPAEHATRDDLLAWRTALTVSKRSVVQYVSAARAFYVWLVEEDRLTVNPARRIPVPKLGRQLPRPIGLHDLITAITKAPQPIRIWLVLAAFMGLRCKEIALLRRECILDTLPRPMLLVAADATKGVNERMVPLSSFVLGELHAYGMPGSGWMFPRKDGKPGPNRPARVSQAIGLFLRSIGILASAHMGRHYFATELLRETKNARMVQEMLGHQTMASVAVYTLIVQDDAAAAMEALPVPDALKEAA